MTSTNYGEISGYIFSTTDYNKFKKLEGNRDVLDSRVANLICSIQERGWIRNPIVVNEKMEIIDGQGRAEALHQLEMPIEFVVAEGATIDDCIALNIRQKNWSLTDYINSFAVRHFPDYVILDEKVKEYHGVLQTEAISLMLGKNGGSKSQKDVIQNGRYVIADIETVEDRLDFLLKAMDIIGSERGRSCLWAAALKFVYLTDKIQNDVFLDKLSKYRVKLGKALKEDDAIASLDTIYNYNKKSGKIYFLPLWSEYKHSR